MAHTFTTGQLIAIQQKNVEKIQKQLNVIEVKLDIILNKIKNADADAVHTKIIK